MLLFLKILLDDNVLTVVQVLLVSHSDVAYCRTITADCTEDSCSSMLHTGHGFSNETNILSYCNIIALLLRRLRLASQASSSQ